MSVLKDWFKTMAELFLDKIDYPNWEYVAALKLQIRKAGFKETNTDAQLESALTLTLDRDRMTSDGSTYERLTSGGFTRIYFYTKGNVRDPSNLLIATEEIRRNDGIQTCHSSSTTFFHYVEGHPSANTLQDLIGPQAVQVRPPVAIANPEPPSFRLYSAFARRHPLGKAEHP